MKCIAIMNQKVIRAFFLLAALLCSQTTFALESDKEMNIVNGEVVEKQNFPEVVALLKFGQISCTATIVGAKTLITAGHCGTTGTKVTFKTAGKEYKGIIHRYPKFYMLPTGPASYLYDLGMVITEEEITDVDYASVGGSAQVGLEIQHFGFGCSLAGGSPDGQLRRGKAKILSLEGYNMNSGSGAAVCPGDSGGPAFYKHETYGRLFLGIHSGGNSSNYNLSARTDLQEGHDWLKEMSETHKLEICGINSQCYRLKDRQ